MTDIRARLADAMRQHWIRAAPSGNGCSCGSTEAQPYHLADVLLSTPGIAIVDTSKGCSIFGGTGQCAIGIAGSDCSLCVVLAAAAQAQEEQP